MNYSLCNFLQPHVTSSIIVPNINLSTVKHSESIFIIVVVVVVENVLPYNISFAGVCCDNYEGIAISWTESLNTSFQVPASRCPFPY
jgi:hypothetical protein